MNTIDIKQKNKGNRTAIWQRATFQVSKEEVLKQMS